MSKSQKSNNMKAMKVTLSEADYEYVERIAQKLGITAPEVLRKGLKLMSVYADTYNKENSRLILEDDDTKTQLMVL